MIVDARGDQCPIPVIKTKKAISELKENEILEVLVDNETAFHNVKKMACSMGAVVEESRKSEKEYAIRLFMKAGADEEISDNSVSDEHSEGIKNTGSSDHMGDTANSVDFMGKFCDGAEKKGDFIVVVSSECMGSGNDALGKVLMKGFLFAVSQLETLPSRILFYNGGATLTTEGSPVLEDLKMMEEQGVEILTCGTCLDYYQLKDQLAVGSVTNMYAIVEAMVQAGKIVRP